MDLLRPKDRDYGEKYAEILFKCYRVMDRFAIYFFINKLKFYCSFNFLLKKLNSKLIFRWFIYSADIKFMVPNSNKWFKLFESIHRNGIRPENLLASSLDLEALYNSKKLRSLLN